MKTHRILNLILGSGIIAAILITCYQSPTVSHASSAAAAQPRGASSQATVHAAGRGNPWISLGDGFDLSDTSAGQQEATRMAQLADWRPTALASADFDEDGVADIVSGYASGEGGFVAVRRGNADSIYPGATKQIDSPSPFESEERVIDVAIAPEFLSAGDFNNDGREDILATRPGSSALYLIPGDGRGGLRAAERRELPGSVTAITTGEIGRADGATEVAVAVAGGAGPRLLVFKSLKSEPQVITLPAEAKAIAVGQLDNGYESDLAVAAGRSLLMIRGRDETGATTVEARELDFEVVAMAAGDFGGDHREELALVAEDGAVRLLERADEELFMVVDQVVGREDAPHVQPVEQPGEDAPGQTSNANHAGESGVSWRMSEAIDITESAPSGDDRAPLLVAAKVSAGPKKDLILLDSANHQLRILSQEAEPEDRAALPRLAASLDVDGGAIAALPMRLNKDALSDLVILRSGSRAPTVILSAPSAIFNVINTNNAGAGSLRQAIIDANALTGADEIRFNIPGAGPHTINLTAGLPFITQPVVIDGTTEPDFTAGTPVVEINGAGAGAGQVGLAVGAAANNCTIRGLVVNRFTLHGIQIQGSGNNIIEGNLIGTDPGGTIDRGNTQLGVGIFDSSNNVVGGTTAAARNIISGNNSHGVQIFDSASAGVAATNQIRGNFIGTNKAGTADLGNSSLGVAIFDSPNNVIGGVIAGVRNVISGNDSHGIQIANDPADGNRVQGNLIGTDVTGTIDLGNTGDGVRVTLSADNATIGGAVEEARNVISGNNSDGVEIVGAATTGNLVQGNFIGSDEAGEEDLGNNSDGVEILDAPNNTIGGTVEGAENLIAGNNANGVAIDGPTANGNLIQRNFITGNSSDGVETNAGASNNRIGGPAPGTGNLIFFNLDDGVDITSGTGNTISMNSIAINGSLGIELNDNDGVTPNDTGDADAGSNDLQNFPVLLSACTTGGNTILFGTLNSTANTQFSLEFFTNPACDDSGFGEGASLIHTMTVTTDASGNATFTANISPAIPDGESITATATNPAGSTSEFSKCLQVTSNPGVVARLTPETAVNPAGTNHTVTAFVILNCSPASGVTVNFNILAGPNAGQSGTGTTNSSGQASFTYTSNGATGTDTIQASGTASGMPFSVTAQKTWASTSSSCSTDTPKAIVDEDVITSTLTITGSQTIFDVNVKLFINHSFTGDLVATLTSPAGTSVDLFIGVGDGQNFGSTCSPQPNCVIDDEAATDIEDADAPFVGSFNPGGDELLSAFDGENAQGVWTLEIEDTFEGDAGTLNCWCLEFLSAPTAVKLNSFEATAYDGGAFLEWRTGFEVDNLGFRLYRDEGGGRVLINPQIIAGSALLTGPSTSLTAGYSYAWWDAAPASKRAQYWLEDIDLKGRSTMHGPFTPRFQGGEPPARSNAALLSQAGRSQNGVTLPLSRRAQVVRPSTAQQQNAIANNPAVKISVSREGWYRVTAAGLVQAGLNPNVNPALLQMYVDGEQLPIGVVTSEDGRVSAVEFYGLGLDAAHSDTRVYWLVEGGVPGARIEQVKAEGVASDADSFLHTVERKDRTIYFSSLRNGERENFFGAVVTQEPVTQSLSLNHLAQPANRQARLKVSLQGVTFAPHQAQVEVNGSIIGNISFNGQELKSAEFSFDQSLLAEGQNEVKLVSQAGASDISLIDYIQVSYWRSFTADGDQLRLTATGGQAVTIGGFSGEDVRVFDVTNPGRVQEMVGKVQSRANDFSITVTAPGAGERVLLAARSNKAAPPSKVAANILSNLKTGANAASFVVVTDQRFIPALAALKARRESQGHKVMIVAIEDVFDEFSFGHKSPQAVKDFLSFAKGSWKTAPQNVLFAADASFDPKNYLGLGDTDIVPTKLVDTFFMEAASDDWLADFDGDGLAEMGVGRLPARTQEEITAAVKKILAYESTAPMESVVLVSDINDGFDFEAASRQLRELLPPQISADQIDRGSLDAETAKRRLIESIDKGAKVINYVGHGSVDLWRGGLLTSEDAAGLSNKGHLPVFVMMSCLNGYFIDPEVSSLAESLMRVEQAGAVAVWASSGMTLPHEQAAMNQQFYRLVFAPGSNTTLGQATRGSKAAIADLDIRRTWTLFGDPTMKLR